MAKITFDRKDIFTLLIRLTVACTHYMTVNARTISNSLSSETQSVSSSHDISKRGVSSPQNQTVLHTSVNILDFENETCISLLELSTPAEPVNNQNPLGPGMQTVPFRQWKEYSNTNQQLSRLQQSMQQSTNTYSRPQRSSLASSVGSSLSTSNIMRHVARNLNGQRRSINDLLNSQQNNSSSLDILQQHPQRFNVTMGQDSPLQNVDSGKLLEIILLMRSDCTLLPQRILKWVSKKRAILFQCRNGAWVVTFIKRGTPTRIRPVSVKDCHESHLTEISNGRPQFVTVTYNDGNNKTWPVLCRHDESHTQHELIDNHLDPSPSIGYGSHRRLASSWTIIQRRINGTFSFYKPLRAYKRGFGDPQRGEYWIGLTALHEMTHLRKYKLRVVLTMVNNRTFISDYDHIKIASESRNYRLKLGAYIVPSLDANNNSAGDIMAVHAGGHFHARDSENYAVNCARLYGTGFWFRGCWATINLNGPYSTAADEDRGVRWARAENEVVRVWKTEMMIQPVFDE